MKFVVVACGYCIMNSQFVSSLDSLFLSEVNNAFREIDEFSAEPPHFTHFNHLPPQRPNASSTHQTAHHHKLSTTSTHASRNNHPLPSNSHTHSPLSTDASESKSESGGWCIKKKKKPKTQNQEVSPAAGSFIHVRARRGQATDSHSLAERIRREKISQRTKVLQTLVPGCHKVTGKARMLDEIINYVQSLQNQVEFLSMKLASVNSILYDFGMDHPEIWQGNGNGMVSHSQQAELAHNYMATCNTYQATGGSDSPVGNSSCFIPLDVNPSPLFLEHGNNTSLVQLP